jgi:hypothetical protein
MISDSCGHRWRAADAFVNPAEVVKGNTNTLRLPNVFPTFC